MIDFLIEYNDERKIQIRFANFENDVHTLKQCEFFLYVRNVFSEFYWKQQYCLQTHVQTHDIFVIFDLFVVEHTLNYFENLLLRRFIVRFLYVKRQSIYDDRLI